METKHTWINANVVGHFCKSEESTNPEVPSEHQDHQRASLEWMMSPMQQTIFTLLLFWLLALILLLSGQLISFVVAQICFEITSVAHKGMKWQTSLTSQELKSCCHPPLCKSAGQNKKGVQTNSKQDLFFQHPLHAGYLYQSEWYKILLISGW